MYHHVREHMCVPCGFQRDKCQVGNMHISFGNFSSFNHGGERAGGEGIIFIRTSLLPCYYHLYLHASSTHSYTCTRILGRFGDELKRRVVMIVGHRSSGLSSSWTFFPCERYSRNWFSKMPKYNYRALRLHVGLVVEAPKGKWGSQRSIEQRRGILPRVGQACGEWGTVGC